MAGLKAEESSTVHVRIIVIPGMISASAKRPEPQFGQKRRKTVFPESPLSSQV
jgi:hypothetical protein